MWRTFTNYGQDCIPLPPTCWLIIHVCLLTLHCLEHSNAVPFLPKYLLNPFTSLSEFAFSYFERLILIVMGTSIKSSPKFALIMRKGQGLIQLIYSNLLLSLNFYIIACWDYFCCCFQNHVFQKLFQEYHQSVKQFGSNSGPAVGRT